MRQVITEREEVHRMSSKNKTEVLIDGKIYTLSGYESEEYLQRVATYINNKLAELKKLDGYARLSQELKSILLELNVADDYFKAKLLSASCDDLTRASRRKTFRFILFL